MFDHIEEYGLGLIVEECGEVLQQAGKALRFGMDSPGVKDALTGEVNTSITPRIKLAEELGDVLAAIDYLVKRNIIDENKLNEARLKKRNKLLNPESKDNLGRRLAP